MMLHKQDEHILFLNPSNKDSVYCMDVERETVVDQWKTDHHFHDIVPQTKFSGMDNTPTFVAVGNTGAFMIDPRCPSNTKQKPGVGFVYARSANPYFTCGTTTANGELVLGSEKGDIRLFDTKQIQSKNPNDSLKTRAKNQLHLSGSTFGFFYSWLLFFPTHLWSIIIL
jgi:hypothetical protein